MNHNHPKYALGVFGASGTGKTTFALSYLANTKARLVFIFDPEGEFAARFGLPACQTAEQIAAAAKRGGFVIFDPDHMFPGRHEDAFVFFCACALAVAKQGRGRSIFVVDELQRFVTGHQVPRELSEIVQTGRRYEMDTVFIGQQPNLLHNAVRTQLTEVVCFQLTDLTALDPLRSCGFDLEEIPGLAEHCWVSRNTRTGEELRGGPTDGQPRKSAKSIPAPAKPPIKTPETRRQI